MLEHHLPRFYLQVPCVFHFDEIPRCCWSNAVALLSTIDIQVQAMTNFLVLLLTQFQFQVLHNQTQPIQHPAFSAKK